MIRTRLAYCVGALFAIAIGYAAYFSLVPLLAGSASLTRSLGSIGLLAAGVLIPSVLIYKKRSGGWFNPLAFPAAYLAVVLITPAAFVAATGLRLAQLTPDIVTPALILILGLLFVGYLAGTMAGMSITPSALPDDRHIDYLRLRTVGRAVLIIVCAAEALEVLLTAGMAYGQDQVTFGPRAELASVVKVGVVAGMALIVVANLATSRRAMFPRDWFLFGFLSLLIFSSGSRGDAVPGLILIAWGWLSQRRVPWGRLVLLTAAIAVLFAGIVAARAGASSLLPASGQQTAQALLGSLASPSYLTANVARIVPVPYPYMHGTTYLQDLYWQLPGFVSRMFFGLPHTGAYAYRYLVSFDNPNQGFGFAMPAEAYMNFGPLGVPIVGLIVGLLFGWAWRKLRGMPTKVEHVFYLILLCTFPSAIRSDALGGMKLVLYPVLILWLAFYFCRVKDGRPGIASGAMSPGRAVRANHSRLERRPSDAIKPAHFINVSQQSPAHFRQHEGPSGVPAVPRAAVLRTGARSFRRALTPVGDNERLPAGSATRARRIGSRAAGALADQAFSSLTNFVVAFAALRYLDVSGLGEFTLAYFGTQLVISVLRSLVLEPLTIRYTTIPSDVRRRATGAASGASLLIGLAALLLAGAPALIFRSHGWLVAGAVGLVLPVLLVQDSWRFHLFAAGRVWAAATNDAVCLVFTAAFTMLAVVLFQHSATLFLISWGLGTSCGLLLGIWQTGTVPRPRAGPGWLSSNRDLGPHLAIGGGLEFAASQVALAIIGVVGGVAAAGRIGSSRTLVTPATTLTAGINLFAVPEARRIYRHGRRQLGWFSVAVSLVVACGMAAWVAGLYVMPDRWGQDIIGRNWPIAKSLLLPIAIWSAAAGARGGAAVGLRVLQRGRLIATLSALTAPLIVAGVFVGVEVGGARGAAWGFAIVYCFAVFGWWITYLRAKPHQPEMRTLNPEASHLKHVAEPTASWLPRA